MVWRVMWGDVLLGMWCGYGVFYLEGYGDGCGVLRGRGVVLRGAVGEILFEIGITRTCIIPIYILQRLYNPCMYLVAFLIRFYCSYDYESCIKLFLSPGFRLLFLLFISHLSSCTLTVIKACTYSGKRPERMCSRCYPD